ncbi:MAG TPA: PH domain-containing protein [Blastocatellia bacterium]|nr:PH domain-containing protein [Blastocatellia bacterium]
MGNPTIHTIHAKFNPLIRPYLVMKIGLVIASSIVGLPLALIWFLGVGQWWARHYFEKLECHLDGQTLRYRKGILVQVEKTIPLENIQDVTFIEGPVLRHFQLSTLKFETAGHSAGQASDMHLTGIIDAHNFRNEIFAAREALRQAQRGHQTSEASAALSEAHASAQIAALQGIEFRLDEIIGLLKNRE